MIGILVGTRPEIIKVAPVIRELDARKHRYILIHSNQHYSKSMDEDILNDLKIKNPDYNLRVGSASHAVQTGSIMEKLEPICQKEKISLLLVHGDTNTTLAGALTAKKLHISVGHIEAGLRSFDYQMPEEINRILVDRISDILLAPTATAQANLKKEGLTKNVYVTGNTVVDALKQHIVLSKNSNILKKAELEEGEYILVTAHRAESVDSELRLLRLISLLEHAGDKTKKKIAWVLHPRTKARLTSFNLLKKVSNSSFTILNPIGYIDMLHLMNKAFMILTDSGGVQEEAYILQKPLCTLRSSTERPETLSANRIIDLDAQAFDTALSDIKDRKYSWSDAFGFGSAATSIVDALENYMEQNL